MQITWTSSCENAPCWTTVTQQGSRWKYFSLRALHVQVSCNLRVWTDKKSGSLQYVVVVLSVVPVSRSTLNFLFDCKLLSCCIHQTQNMYSKIINIFYILRFSLSFLKPRLEHFKTCEVSVFNKSLRRTKAVLRIYKYPLPIYSF